MKINNIGIIGLGFMGGCLARRLSKKYNVVAFDKDKTSLKQALEDNNISSIATSLSDFNDCDLIFLCTPVGYIKDIVLELKKYIKKDCIITDIGSTKKRIVEDMRDIDVLFVGGHPMVGSERVGYISSNDILYENSYYIICEDNNKEEVEVLKSIINDLGAIPIIIDYNKHDYVVAAISHLPQLVAYTLVNLVKELDDEDEYMKTLAAGGFKDVTRIASSDPVMWMHICETNKKEIVPILEKYIDKLEELKNIINTDNDTYEIFKNSKEYRDSFINNNKINGIIRPSISVSIKDEKGTLLKVISILTNNDIDIKDISIENNRESSEGVLLITFNNMNDKELAKKILVDSNYDIYG